MSAYREPQESRIRDIVKSARVVAVVGMKNESSPHVPAFTVPRGMQARGIRIIPVNPMIASSLGVPAKKQIGDVGEKVDLVQVFRRSDAIPALTEEILALPEALRPPVVWMQSGIVDVPSAEKMQNAGIEVVMDRCFAVEASKYRDE